MGRLIQRVAFLAAFLVAILSLASGWKALQAAWSTSTPADWLRVVGWGLVFVAAFLYLGFWVYAWDRAAGRVKRPIGFYERVLRGKAPTRPDTWQGKARQ